MAWEIKQRTAVLRPGACPTKEGERALTVQESETGREAMYFYPALEGGLP